MAMWAFTLIASHEASGGGAYNWSYIIKYNVKAMILGIIIFAIPYETIFTKICRVINHTNYTESVHTLMKYVIMCMVYVAVGIFFICFTYKYPVIDKNIDLYAVLLSLIAYAIILQSNSIIESNWLSAASAVFIMVLNAIMTNEISQSLPITILLYIAGSLMWCIWQVMEHRFDLIVTIVTVIVLAAAGIGLFNFIEYRPQNLYLIYDNIFEKIQGSLGVLGIVGFAFAFFIMTVCVIYAILKLSKVSVNRGAMVATIYLAFVGILCYGLLQKLPLSSVYLMNNAVYIPVMSVAFRCFYIRKGSISRE